jgi:drug/metabolite transporter (DMT)-like permease
VIAGIGGFAGTAALYHGLAAGNMAVAGPLSAVAAAGLPVIVDLAAGNALPVTGLAGVAAALPGIWLVSTSSKAGRASRTGVRDGLAAGLGFAVLFIGLERAGDGGGVWPVAVSQGTGLVGMLVVAALWRPAGARLSASGILPGVLGFSGSLLYLLATRSAPLALVAVVTSLYPAVTVGLAGVVLKERTTWAQGWGLLLCGAAVCSFALT